MTRPLSVVAVVALLLVGCSNTERPEGIVERWLLALNQGRAGEPERYAPLDVSRRILPEYPAVDPGDFDVIEVGKAFVGTCGVALPPAASCPAGTASASVPFRVVMLDGRAFDLDAHLLDEGEGWRIEGLLDFPRNVPSRGGLPLAGASADVWLIALGVGIVVIVVSEGAMRLAQTRRD